MRKIWYLFVLTLCSCGYDGYKAEEEVEYLHNKLDSISSMAEEASDIISNFPEDNDDANMVYGLLEGIKEESEYRDFEFYYPE